MQTESCTSCTHPPSLVSSDFLNGLIAPIFHQSIQIFMAPWRAISRPLFHDCHMFFLLALGAISTPEALEICCVISHVIV